MNVDPPGFASIPHDSQLAVFERLSPYCLGVTACVSKQWRQLVAEQPAWRDKHAQLWPSDAAAATDGSTDPAAAADAAASDWQRRYGERQQLARCWLGRPALDRLAGHGGQAVKAVFLLPEQAVLFSGGVDRVVRAWDLHSGIQLAASRRHGGTVRCLVADGGLLASGSSDHGIRVWLRTDGGSSITAAGLTFDLAGGREVLTGHTGPVSALALTPKVLVSASWDCSIRCWDRASLTCVALVHTDDWVYSLALRGGVLAAACRSEVLLLSLKGSAPERLGALTPPSRDPVAANGMPAVVTAVELTADGRNVFIGTHDGGVWLGEVHCGRGTAPRPLLQHQPWEVSSLSWDHPWLAVADLAGNVLLLDAGGVTLAGSKAMEGSLAAATRCSKGSGSGSKRRPELASRLLFSASIGGASAGAQCVGLAGSWVAAGLDCGGIVSWDGSKGLAALAAAAATRQQKAQRRQRNQERQAAQQHRGLRPRRSQAVAVPSSGAHALVEQQQQGQQQQPQPAEQSPSGGGLLGRSPSSRVRVPAPLHPDVLAASAMASASSCRQQGPAWQVLGSIARPGPGDGGGLPAGPVDPATSP